MKRIPKFQQGGGFESLFTIYKPVQTDSPRRAQEPSRRGSASKDKDDSDKGKLTEKDLFTMLKDLDGLPNDMQQLVGSLTSTLRMTSLMGNPDISGLATTYLSNLYKLKQAKFNKEQYDETYKIAVQKGSLNEVAITTNGAILVYDQNKQLTQITPEQWAEARGSNEYTPVTNANLLWLRAHDPSFINDNRILQTVENGVGLDQVHKMIKDRFAELGKTETGQENFYQKGAAVKGAEIIERMLALGPEGYYKIQTELSQTDERQVAAALEYIYTTLPDNAKTRLRIETKDGSHDSALGIINSMIFRTLDTKSKNTVSYVGSEEKLTGTSGKKGTTKDLETNTATRWLMGLGNQENFVINLGGSSSFVVRANTMPLVKMSGDYLGVNSTLQQMTEGQFSSVLDLRNASMGMKTIDPTFFGQVVLSDGKISSIDFPFIEQNGVIVPDLSPETRSKKDRADARIRERGINLSNPADVKQNYQVINEIYQNEGLPPAYDAEGNPNLQSWRRFGVINAKASNKALGMDQWDSSPLLEEDTNDANVQNFISITKDENWDDNSYMGLSGVDHLYKGTVWIPVQVSYQAALASQKMDAGEAMDLERREQAYQASQLLTNERAN